MADDKPVSERIGLTRGKALLIGTLAIVLGGVVYMQYGSGGTAEVPSGSAYRPPQPVQRAAPPIKPTNESTDATRPEDQVETAFAAFDENRWKSPKLTTVVAYDPFALPAAFPQPRAGITGPDAAADSAGDRAADERAIRLAEAVERLEKQLEDLKQRGVHVIVGGRDEFVAVIGDRTLRVGDEINGFTVTAIEPDGVRVVERTGVE